MFPLYMFLLTRLPPFFSNKIEYNPFDTIFEVHRLRRAPLRLYIKHLYPRIYRVDNCGDFDSSKENAIIKEFGIPSELTGEVTKPYVTIALMDAINFAGIYLIDTGYDLHTLIFGEVADDTLKKLFGVTWEKVEDIKEWDRFNETDINYRVLSILQQLRFENDNENIGHSFHVLTFMFKQT